MQSSAGSVSSVGRRDGLLRTVLRLDALASGAVGILLVAGSPWLDGLFGASTVLHVAVGLALILYAAVVFAVAARSEIYRRAAWMVVSFNVLWTILSLATAVSGVFSLTSFGVAFVLFQGLVVALFAVAEGYALRRSA